MPFALLSVAGQLAQTFKILPGEARVREVIAWAWGRYAASAGAMALNPEEQAIEALRAYIAERWDVTIKSVSSETGVNNREAIGWYDDDTVYLPTDRLREGCRGLAKEQWIAQTLRDRGMLTRQGDPAKGRIAVKYIPKIGHVQSYALARSSFGRERRDEATQSWGKAANAY